MTSALRRRYASICSLVASAPFFSSCSNLIFGVLVISSLTAVFFPGSDMRCPGIRVEICDGGRPDVSKRAERKLSDGLVEVNIAARHARLATRHARPHNFSGGMQGFLEMDQNV